MPLRTSRSDFSLRMTCVPIARCSGVTIVPGIAWPHPPNREGLVRARLHVSTRMLPDHRRAPLRGLNREVAGIQRGARILKTRAMPNLTAQPWNARKGDTARPTGLLIFRENSRWITEVVEHMERTSLESAGEAMASSIRLTRPRTVLRLLRGPWRSRANLQARWVFPAMLSPWCVVMAHFGGSRNWFFYGGHLAETAGPGASNCGYRRLIMAAWSGGCGHDGHEISPTPATMSHD